VVFAFEVLIFNLSTGIVPASVKTCCPAWVRLVYQQFPQLVIDEFQVYNLVLYAA